MNQLKEAEKKASQLVSDARKCKLNFTNMLNLSAQSGLVFIACLLLFSVYLFSPCGSHEGGQV